MQVPYLDLKAIHEPIRSEMESVYAQVLDESYFVKGSAVSVFEKAFADKCGASHCVATGNCTDALEIVLRAKGIGPGDEVIVPAMTWITDAEVVSNLGGHPVFVDIDISFTIDVSKIEAAITSNTKAIIAVHLYGQMAAMNAIMDIADKHDLFVIEDVAQAHFAKQEGRVAGAVGHASVFSFYPTKNLGALGDAGCILTSDEALAMQCRKLANHGALDKHTHEFPGSNSRMDTLQAAVLLLKLNYIDEWNKERRALAHYYIQGLGDVEGIYLPQTAKGNEHVFHIFQMTVVPFVEANRDQLKDFLEAHGVQTAIHYPKALPFTKAYAHLGHKNEDFLSAYLLQREGISLPLYPGMTQGQQDYVIEKIKEFYTG